MVDISAKVVPEPNDVALERMSWCEFSLASLAQAYADDEPEYSLSMVKEADPD